MSTAVPQRLTRSTCAFVVPRPHPPTPAHTRLATKPPSAAPRSSRQRNASELAKQLRACMDHEAAGSTKVVVLRARLQRQLQSIIFADLKFAHDKEVRRLSLYTSPCAGACIESTRNL